MISLDAPQLSQYLNDNKNEFMGHNNLPLLNPN